MKQLLLLALTIGAFMLAGCTTMKPPANLSGEWRWVCCSGKYWGEMKLTQFEGDKLAGAFHDTSDSHGGSLEGKVTGNYVQLTRSFFNSQQQMTLALSADRRTLNGSVTGTVDGMAWAADFEAHRR